MKKIIIIFALLLSMSYLAVSVNAQEEEADVTTTPAPTKEETGIKEKINDLKERLATKVAELRSQNKRAFYGVIKEKDDTSLTLLYRDQEVLVAIDDETSFFSVNAAGKKADTTLDKFELGETAAVFGHLDLDNKTVVATSLYEQQLPLIDHGKVTEIDEDDGSFTINSSNGSITLDYEITTRCTVVEDDKKVRCGLTSIVPGDWVFLRIDPSKGDLTRATALRILVFHIPEPSPTATSTPTLVPSE